MPPANSVKVGKEEKGNLVGEDKTSLPNEGISEASPYVQGTTLLKVVPYDLEEEEDFIRRKWEDGRYLNPGMDAKELAHCKLTEYDEGWPYVEAHPALHVISVSVFNRHPNMFWERSIVYGHISVTDHGHEQHSFSIYNRDSDHPQNVSPDQMELCLTRCPIAPVAKGKVSFRIFNNRGIPIIASDEVVGYSIGDDCDGGNGKEKELLVRGNNGFYAKMVYTIIPFAQMSDVHFCLAGPPGSKTDTIRVEGEIIANNNINFLRSKELKLVNKGKSEVPVYPIRRTVIAVSLLSSLCVKFSLTVSGAEFAAGELDSYPRHRFDHADSFDFKFDEKHYHFRIDAEWLSPLEYFGQICRQLPQPEMSDHYMEVFSVFVGGPSAPALCGTIAVRDRDETCYIFSRNKMRPDNLKLSRKVSLAWPTDRWVLEKDFYMHLKLEDDKKRPLCRGFLSVYADPSRFDRRMCAVIRGEDGYFAAVYYSIFRYGLRAQVTVTVECKDLIGPVDVYGSVYGRYNNYEYSSKYDDEYYRIVIFDRLEECRAKVENCSEIPLSKSLVTAPSDCAELSIAVSLRLRPPKDGMLCSDLFAIDTVRFKASTNACQQLPLYLCASGLHRRGMVTVKVDWFGCCHGSRV